jgi:hypothetical protein
LDVDIAIHVDDDVAGLEYGGTRVLYNGAGMEVDWKGKGWSMA